MYHPTSALKNLLFSALFAFSFCTAPPKNLPDLKTTVDQIVTRLYEEIPSDSLNLLDEAFFDSYLTEEEKAVMSTQYWIFEVNQPVRISLMRHVDQKTVPFWLEKSGFVKTNLLVKNELSSYEVWQKEEHSGKVNLGINGLDKHRPVYFISLNPLEKGKKLEITPIFPAQQHFETLEPGAFTYHDWDGLKITEVPDEIRGEILFTTIRGRAREAHLVEAFRSTDFPSSEVPDLPVLHWHADPKTSISINWRTSPKSTTSKVLYWKKGGKDTLSLASSPQEIEDRLLQNDRFTLRHTARISGLNPGTAYHYQIQSDDELSPVYSFETAADRTPNFSFIWFGDIHNDPKTGQLAKDATTRFPETKFYISSGDLVNTGLHRDDWDKLFAFTGESFAHRPFMPVPGNHDSQDGLGAGMFQVQFDLPVNGPGGEYSERTYFFRYGEALFLMMDGTLSIPDQAAWLEKVLAENPARWKFLTVHFPAYNSVEPYPEIQDFWVPILEKHEVDLYFSGHFHYYMRSKPLREFKPGSNSNLIFVHSASAHGKGFESDKQDQSFTVLSYPDDYLYQKIDIQGNTLTLSSYLADGKLLDQFTIKK
ncbi:MAG: fibronectin type III domain-containing protein [Algoriphagus aquaeductus]|uniref:fibronectin type III domain-containing protein n=1 Tax=Algoriphagus aquaeductus TaxID=475299 RepID=UPI00391AC783